MTASTATQFSHYSQAGSCPSNPAQTETNFAPSVIATIGIWRIQGQIAASSLRHSLQVMQPVPFEITARNVGGGVARRIRRTYCDATSKIFDGDRLRFGADGAAGAKGAVRGGLGLSLDNKGALGFDAYLGAGAEYALTGALGGSYQVNAPTRAQITVSMQAGLGIGRVGGTIQDSYGSQTGGSTSGSIALGSPIPGTGKIGGEATATVNAEGAWQLTEAPCP